MKLDAQYLVIDADIARAAGLTENPVSRNARQLLESVLNNQLGAVFCPILKAEWSKHQSLYATKWRAAMTARKRILHVTPARITHAEIEAAQLLAEKEKQIASKDAHLLDIALSADKLITSNDKTAREVFCKVALQSNKLSEIIWVVPNDDCHQLQTILAQGGYVPVHWKLRD